MKILSTIELEPDFPLRKNQGLIYRVLYQCGDAEFQKFNQWREDIGMRILAGTSGLYFKSSEDLALFMLKWS